MFHTTTQTNMLSFLMER
jgi:hypothetical protein